MARVSFAPPSPEQIAEARRLAQQSLRPVNWQGADPVTKTWAPDSPQMRVLTAITAPLRYLLEETIAGKTLQRVSERAGERVVFQPGAYQEMYGGYTSTGVPWLDVGADVAGDLTGSLAQIHMANQLLGPALAAVGQVPQVAKAGQAAGKAVSKLPTLAQKIAVRAPRAALTGATVETMRQAMYPEEYKPGAAGIARGALMWAGGSIGNTLVETAMQKAGIVLHPALEAFVEEIGENVGSTIAVTPFVEDKQQLLMELGPDILAEGLYEAVGRLIAGGPVDYESARIRVEMKQDLREYTANKDVNPEKADAAYKRFWKRINDLVSPVAEAAEAPKVPDAGKPEQLESADAVRKHVEALPSMPSGDRDERKVSAEQAQMQADSDDLDLGWLEQRLDETHGVAGQDVQRLSTPEALNLIPDAKKGGPTVTARQISRFYAVARNQGLKTQDAKDVIKRAAPELIEGNHIKWEAMARTGETYNQLVDLFESGRWRQFPPEGVDLEALRADAELGKTLIQELKEMDKEAKTLQKAAKPQIVKTGLIDAIRKLGGIKSPKASRTSAGYPGLNSLRKRFIGLLNNKTGREIDEIVPLLRDMGWHFEDANALYEALQSEASAQPVVDPTAVEGLANIERQRAEIEEALAEIRQRAEGVSEVWILPKETGQAQQMVAQAVPQGEAAAELEKRAKTIDFSLEESDDLSLIVMPNAEGKPEIVGAWWRSPVEGVEVFVPNMPEPTDEIRAMLRSQPSYYAAHFAVMRDLFGEPIVRQWRVANTQFERFVKEYERILTDIFKPFAKNPQARKKITLMLEGKLPIEGPEGVAAMRLRKEFYGDNPNSGLFRQFNMDPDMFNTKYSPRMREHGDLESAFPGGLPREYEFFARMHRSGELDPRETDALNIALAYLRQGAKEKFYNPVIERVNPLVDEMHPDRRFIYEQWTNTILGRPALQERLANEAIRKVANLVLKPFGREVKGRPAQAASSFLADLSYQGTMAWTLSAPLKNLTQQALTIGHLDKKPGQGLKYWAKARVAKHTKTGKELLKYCWVVQDRQYLEGLDAQYQFMQKVTGTTRKYGFFLFRQADIDNVTNAYLGGTLQALDEGKSLAEAVESGNQVAMSTQFMMGLDSPMLFKSPLGRLVGIYSSWPVNFMRLLWEQGSSAQKHRIASTIVSMIGVAYLMEKLTGLSFKSTRPEEVVKDYLPVKLVTGETSSPPVNAASSAIRWLLGAASSADPEFIEAAKNEFIKNMKSFIPGHNAYSAAVRFIEDAVNDWKRYDERGRLTYEVTPGEAVRDLIGTTVESEQRQKQHQEIERTKKRYSELRAKAIDAYLAGDGETYREAQAQLQQEFRTMVTQADIQRERQLRQQTGMERHATGLPQTIRQMMGLDTAGTGSVGGLGSFRVGSAMPRSRLVAQTRGTGSAGGLGSFRLGSAMPRSRLATQTRGIGSAGGLGSFRLGSAMPRSRLATQTRLASMIGG